MYKLPDFCDTFLLPINNSFGAYSVNTGYDGVNTFDFRLCPDTQFLRIIKSKDCLVQQPNTTFNYVSDVLLFLSTR